MARLRQDLQGIRKEVATGVSEMEKEMKEGLKEVRGRWGDEPVT